MVNKKGNGQSLMEVIIALAVASLVAVGLVRVGATAVKSGRFSRDQSRMVNFAQGKIATIVDYKNTNPDAFWTVSYYPPNFDTVDYNEAEGYCVMTSVTPVVLPPETPNFAEAKMVQINVKIFWDEKGAGTQCDGKDFNHSLNFDTYVTN